MSRPYMLFMLVSFVANKTTSSHSLFIYSFCLSVIRKIFNFCAAESNEEVTFHFEIPDLLPSEVRTTNTNCYWSTAHNVSHSTQKLEDLCRFREKCFASVNAGVTGP